MQRLSLALPHFLILSIPHFRNPIFPHFHITFARSEKRNRPRFPGDGFPSRHLALEYDRLIQFFLPDYSPWFPHDGSAAWHDDGIASSTHAREFLFGQFNDVVDVLVHRSVPFVRGLQFVLHPVYERDRERLQNNRTI